MQRFSSVALCALACLMAAPVFADDLKIGVVDVQKVMEAQPEWTKAVADLKRDWDKKSAELEGKQNELQKSKEKLDGKRALVSDTKALEREEEALIEQLKGFRRDTMMAQQMFQQREAVLKDQMLARIEQVVYKLAAEGDYAYIFESGSPDAPNVLYRSKSVDITDRIIKDYKAAYKGKALDPNAPLPRGPAPTP